MYNLNVWGVSLSIAEKINPIKDISMRLGRMAFDVVYKDETVVRHLYPVIVDISDVRDHLSESHVRNEWEKALRFELGCNENYRHLFPNPEEITDVVPVRLNTTIQLIRAGWRQCSKPLNLVSAIN